MWIIIGKCYVHIIVIVIVEGHTSEHPGGPLCDGQTAVGRRCQIHGGDGQRSPTTEYVLYTVLSVFPLTLLVIVC